MFLVKYLLLAVSFLSSRKQYEYGPDRKNDSLTRNATGLEHTATYFVNQHSTI